MLQQLHIQNYAIIDEIDIRFSSQLNVITGETGAGKSILMGALSLILGDRADTNVLLNTDKKCIVEGIFTVDDKKQVKIFLKENELDNEENLVLRREIATNGKSRAFINDTPVTLQQLKELTSLLVDLHQQFDSLELGNSNFQRDVLDALAANTELLQSYQIQYKHWLSAKKELNLLLQQKQDFNKEFDYHKFLFEELNEASFKENELEDLDNELKILSNAEDIKTILSKVCFDLKESEEPVVQTIKQLINQLQSYASYHKALPGIIERLQSAHIELQDIAGEVDNINNAVNYDENRISFINERLAVGYKLLKKHSVQQTDELLQLQAELEQKLQAVLHIDDAIETQQKEVNTLLQKISGIAADISARRNKEIAPLEKTINRLLTLVGMPNARLKVELKETALNEFGKDAIGFLFDANNTNRFEPIGKVASGGELSRLMLCIKSLVAQSIDLPTMIFDEIDTGISGEAAKQVGIIMKQLADNRQIICITHQPQIAGKGNAHFFVYKDNKNKAINTNIRLLGEEERILTIARMLGGENPSNAALQSAKEMML